MDQISLDPRTSQAQRCGRCEVSLANDVSPGDEDQMCGGMLLRVEAELDFGVAGNVGGWRAIHCRPLAWTPLPAMKSVSLMWCRRIPCDLG